MPNEDVYKNPGDCPFISTAKTLCRGKAGHEGDHWARYKMPNGETKRIVIGKADK